MRDTIGTRSAPLENYPVAPQYSSSRPIESGGAWLWFAQRFTGIALLLLLGLHVWAGHFANMAAVKAGSLPDLVAFSNVETRLQALGFIVLDFALLAVVLWHGLNGMRTVITDFGITGGGRTTVSVILWIIGVAAFVYGANTLLVFITGSGFF